MEKVSIIEAKILSVEEIIKNEKNKTILRRVVTATPVSFTFMTAYYLYYKFKKNDYDNLGTVLSDLCVTTSRVSR